MQRGGLAATDTQDKDSTKKVAQSAEAANINKFLRQLTKCFILNFFTFIVYAAYPYVRRRPLGPLIWCPHPHPPPRPTFYLVNTFRQDGPIHGIDGPILHLVFYIIWKFMLGFCLWCVFRCIRVPTTSWAQWIATLTCCGEKSQEAVASRLGTMEHGIEHGIVYMHQHSLRR